MKAIMVMFDSLNKRMLPPYGCDWTHAPNFQRLAEKTVIFDKSFVGSMPCMPARRELHTGRYNFLHHSWGPLEPFDDSMPEILSKQNIYTHMATDHYHYFEDGGATYHNRYCSYEFFRGHEGDAWKGEVTNPNIPETVTNSRAASKELYHNSWRQDWVNRTYMKEEAEQPQAKTFAAGLEFIEKNSNEDQWFLQIETFDPHEPYFSQQHFKDLYPHEYNGRHFDWPEYSKVTETDDEVQHCRYEYAALLSMCDKYIGKVIDIMDEKDLWKDTMLIVNTDHGFLLGEHQWWSKCRMPFYNEIANTPLFIWDPKSKVKNERRQSLVQTIDLPATLLKHFDLELPENMQGVPLQKTILDDSPVRKGALYGIFGGHVNVTDGRYVYMRGIPEEKENQPLYHYTLLPTLMHDMFPTERLKYMKSFEGFPFTKGARVMQIPAENTKWFSDMTTHLYDIKADPKQLTPIHDKKIELKMINLLKELMIANDAPKEQFERLGLDDS